MVLVYEGTIPSRLSHEGDLFVRRFPSSGLTASYARYAIQRVIVLAVSGNHISKLIVAIK